MDTIIVWSPGVTLEKANEQVIRLAYTFFKSNKTQTAAALDISIRTLDAKLKEYEDADKRRKSDADRTRDADAEYLKRARGPQRSINDSQEERNREIAASFLGTTSGVRVESTEKDSAQSDMPMPKRKEVQAVLPEQTGASSARKAGT